jgi:uracil-DNA glycosylase family 4
MKRDHLEMMGVQRWALRAVASDHATAQELPEVEQLPSQSADPGKDSWQILKDKVASCEMCSLSRTRTQTVFGAGHEDAKWIFVGEAPGAEEDRQGQPFVGRAGKLLTAIIGAIGLRREDVYIANVLKCRPPGNRDPMGEEVLQCQPYLQAQLAHVNPSVIIALGAFAAHALLKSSEPISRLRGRVHHFGESKIPLIATYHPAYLLRSPLEKRKVWNDLQIALGICDDG